MKSSTSAILSLNIKYPPILLHYIELYYGALFTGKIVNIKLPRAPTTSELCEVTSPYFNLCQKSNAI